ncbi:hypothetical protein [Acinetobacter junii]|uniref:Uncharacterized protein n=1 Tax=Acinetobacter junii TaxID=40215 RepID=A0AAW5R5J2_ACIJU|nr:hypothetical protein [Acinetobacter junii]MCU4395968.1 hypothetical protein [Acinetobacter junii]
MLHNLGVDLSTAEQMPMQYALAFVSEKMGFLEKLKHERQQNTHAAPKPKTSDTKSYISTERKHSKPKTGADK